MPDDMSENDGLLAVIGVGVAGLLAWAFLSGDGPDSPQEALSQTIDQTTDAVGLGASDPSNDTESDDAGVLTAGVDSIQSFADTQLGDFDERIGGDLIGGAADSLGVGEQVDSLVAGVDETAPEAVAAISPTAGVAATAANAADSLQGSSDGSDDDGSSTATTGTEAEVQDSATESFQEADALPDTNPDTGGTTTGTQDPVYDGESSDDVGVVTADDGSISALDLSDAY